jgi:hypothetical protein
MAQAKVETMTVKATPLSSERLGVTKITVRGDGQAYSSFVPAEVMSRLGWKHEQTVCLSRASKLDGSGGRYFTLHKYASGEPTILKNRPKGSASTQIRIAAQIARYLDVQKGDVVWWYVEEGRAIGQIKRGGGSKT